MLMLPALKIGIWALNSLFASAESANGNSSVLVLAVAVENRLVF